MVHPCDKPCGNKTASGYCATTVCINPQYSNIGTAQYGQGVQKRIITNADRIRAMTDEELAKWIALHPCLPNCPAQTEECFKSSKLESCAKRWLDWLREVATDG